MRKRLAGGVKVAAAARDAVARPGAGLTVLIYHRVGGPGGSVDLEPSRFDEQVAELASGGKLRTLDDGLATVERPRTGTDDPGSAVVITFDDGTVDFVEGALPILVAHQAPALLYVATKFVEEGTDFPGGGPAVSWAGLADAVSTGLVTIGSHTHSHVLLDRTPRAEVDQELDRSIGLIEDRLGVHPDHFAYPKALLGSAEAQASVAERFASAAIAGTRPNLVGRTDPQRLYRSPIQVADEMKWFRKKAAGGMRFEDDLRRWVNRRRYAGATR